MLRNVTVEIEQGEPDVYEVTQTIALPELKCGETGHSYVVLAPVEGGMAEPSVFSCELKFQVGVPYCGGVERPLNPFGAPKPLPILVPSSFSPNTDLWV